jgi:hypothetical protein
MSRGQINQSKIILNMVRNDHFHSIIEAIPGINVIWVYLFFKNFRWLFPNHPLQINCDRDSFYLRITEIQEENKNNSTKNLVLFHPDHFLPPAQPTNSFIWSINLRVTFSLLLPSDQIYFLSYDPSILESQFDFNFFSGISNFLPLPRHNTQFILKFEPS